MAFAFTNEASKRGILEFLRISSKAEEALHCVCATETPFYDDRYQYQKVPCTMGVGNGMALGMRGSFGGVALHCWERLMMRGRCMAFSNS